MMPARFEHGKSACVGDADDGSHQVLMEAAEGI